MKRPSLLGVLLLLGISPLHAISPTPPRPSPPALTTPLSGQEIVLLLSGISSSKKILLMLNNNRPADLTAHLALYTPDGNEIALPDVALTKDESRLIDLGTVLHLSHITGHLGFLRVTYDGRLMELGAQLTLYPLGGHNGIDSPRSLSTDAKSTHISAVAWAKLGSKTSCQLH